MCILDLLEKLVFQDKIFVSLDNFLSGRASQTENKIAPRIIGSKQILVFILEELLQLPTSLFVQSEAQIDIAILPRPLQGFCSCIITLDN